MIFLTVIPCTSLSNEFSLLPLDCEAHFVSGSNLKTAPARCQGGFHASFRSARFPEDLVSVGPAMIRDFEMLGVNTVAQLARRNPEKLYEKLCEVTGQVQDVCVLDVFRAAVAQARNPRLPIEQAQWWYWSRQRKARDARH